MKSATPPSVADFAVLPGYSNRREDVKWILEALDAGCGADAPGSFAAWLSRHVPMYAFVMPGRRYNVGNVESYREVDMAE